MLMDHLHQSLLQMHRGQRAEVYYDLSVFRVQVEAGHRRAETSFRTNAFLVLAVNDNRSEASSFLSTLTPYKLSPPAVNFYSQFCHNCEAWGRSINVFKLGEMIVDALSQFDTPAARWSMISVNVSWLDYIRGLVCLTHFKDFLVDK